MSIATPSLEGKASSSAEPESDRDEILRAVRVLHEPNSVTEVRRLNGRRTTAGYFDDAEKLADATWRNTEGNSYITLNPCNPALLARCANRIDFADATTSDADIMRRRLLMIDLDHERPAKISATDGEHETAVQLGYQIAHWLLDRHGWPEPVVADSGNGCHLLYRVDLPNDDAATALVQRVLGRLSLEFDQPGGVHVDQTVFNAARITKLYGTVARKGDSTRERPHRLSRLLTVPPTFEPVSRDLLESFAGPPEPKPDPRRTVDGVYGRSGEFSIEDFLRQHVEVTSEGAYTNASGASYRWKLRTCPLCGESDGSACVVKYGDGRVGYRCHHNRCAGRGWQDFREHFEPGYRERREQRDRQHHGAPTGGGFAEESVEPRRVEYQRLTSRDLATGEYTTSFLIDGTLVEGQPLLIAGPQKSLKTSLLVDAAISLAAGGCFLGRLRVQEPRRVAVMSGESGLSTLQETARRVSIAAGLHLHELDRLIWSPDLPRFGSAPHLDALEEFLTADGVEVLFLDPAYLAMPGADAANLMIQGELLQGVSTLCQRLGVTLGIATHTKRNTSSQYDEPLELSDIAWAGFPEFARQWWLVSRRERYEPGSGEHALWLNVGGSAGHSALWAVDVSEGVWSELTPRTWEVAVRPASEVRQENREEQKQQRQQHAEAKQAEQAESDRKQVVDAMARLKRPETASEISVAARLNYKRTKAALLDLEEAGHVRNGVQVTRDNGRSYPGYALDEHAE